MALIEKLTAIGDAIREKNGTTELMTLDAMPIAIAAIETGGGGGGDLPEEALVLTGDCAYRFTQGGWDWFLEKYGDKVTTKDITNAERMFYKSTVDKIPFEINFKDGGGSMLNMFAFCGALTEIPDIDCKHTTYQDMSYVLTNCDELKKLPYLYNAYPSNIPSLFSNLNNLKEIPEDYFDTWNFSRLNTYNYAGMNNVFYGCYSLRQIPKNVLSKFGKETVARSASYQYFYAGFQFCNSLDELTDLPFSSNVAYTSNIFYNTFQNCSRLKDITFETYDTGAAKPAKWKSQTIDLSKYVGYVQHEYNITNFNSGITADKNAANAKDTTDFVENYANDADWYSTDLAYSRYNRRSAINTINSLPDTSAYLAANGGTNTIKFKGDSGSAHPMDYSNPTAGSSAISYLTAEEIAVATAKGWTVTLV